MDINNILRSANINIKAEKEHELLFSAYYQFLTEENNKYNLTAITAEEDVYIKHFADSLTANFLIPRGASVLDIGAGAGFPSVPLLILRPDIKLTLIDSVNKKVNFLKSLLLKLNIRAEAIHCRIEDYKNKEGFDVVTSRAVAPLPTLLEYMLPFAKIGGKIVAYKTDALDAETGKTACNILGGGRIKTYDVSYLDNKRILIEAGKLKASPSAYPRGGNKPRLAPLI